MKRGAHLLAPGPAGVEGIHVVAGWDPGGQNTRERAFTPVMSVIRLSSLFQRLTSPKLGSTVA